LNYIFISYKYGWHNVVTQVEIMAWHSMCGRLGPPSMMLLMVPHLHLNPHSSTCVSFVTTYTPQQKLVCFSWKNMHTQITSPNVLIWDNTIYSAKS
jgi:hypothetical protein